VTSFLRGARLFAALFGFWIILSGEMDAFHLSAGAAVAGVTATAAVRASRGPAFPLGRFLAYVPWLLGQILLSNLRVAGLVLSRRSRIQPRFVRACPRVSGRTALGVTGCSITLTPGTVTVEARPGHLLVHALDATSAAEIREGIVEARVSRIFGGEGA
jgi:multicomponent Na+:H+ antiporter subunit E